MTDWNRVMAGVPRGVDPAAAFNRERACRSAGPQGLEGRQAGCGEPECSRLRQGRGLAAPCKPTSRVLAIDVEAGGKRSQVRLMVDRRGHVYCRTQRDSGLGPATRFCQSTINLVREAITVEADRLTVSRPDPRQ